MEESKILIVCKGFFNTIYVSKYSNDTYFKVNILLAIFPFESAKITNH